MESMCAWYGMTRPSWSQSDHAMTSERRVRGAELASVLSHLYPFIEKAGRRPRSFMTQTACSRLATRARKARALGELR